VAQYENVHDIDQFQLKNSIDELAIRADRGQGPADMAKARPMIQDSSEFVLAPARQNFLLSRGRQTDQLVDSVRLPLLAAVIVPNMQFS